MQNFPKIGLPVIFIIGAIILLISKSAVTIGPGEGGVLFERFGDGIDTEQNLRRRLSNCSSLEQYVNPQSKTTIYF